MARSRYKTLLLIGFLIGAIAVPVIAVTFDPGGAGSVSDGVPFGSPSGMNATIEGSTNVIMESDVLFPASDTVQMKTEAGNITFSSAGPAWASVSTTNITGTYTNLTEIDAQNDITANPEDKRSITVGGNIQTVAWRNDVGADDGTIDFTYSGPSGTSKVVLSGFASNAELFAIDANTGSLLDTATTDGSGTVTFDALTNSEHDVLVQSADSNAPVLSNIEPQGLLDVEPQTISADINDSDFAGIGDSVDVTVDLDGSQVSSQTITSNSTLSTSMPQSGQTGGVHSITVEATDDYGNTVTRSVTYSVPDTLYIRNETNHSQLIPADGEVRIFGEDEVFSRTAPNGTLNLTGLPVNQNLVVEVEPTDDNYTTRTGYLTSIYEQQSLYVLNTSKYATIQSRFTLEDPTGQYGPETVLQIKKGINVNGTTEFQTIVADEFGVEGVTATLEEGQRYRLAVYQDGEAQTVGPYRSDVGETVTVEPGTPSVDLSFDGNNWAAGANLDNVTLQYAYSDPTQETQQLTVAIFERGNRSNNLQPNQTYSDIGNASGQVALTVNESKKEWVVLFDVDRDGESFTKSVLVSNGQDVSPPLGDGWKLMVGVGMILLFAGSFSVLNAAVGAVVVSLVGGVLWFLGFLGPATSGIAIAIAIVIAMANYSYRNTR